MLLRYYVIAHSFAIQALSIDTSIGLDVASHVFDLRLLHALGSNRTFRSGHVDCDE